MNRHSPLYSVRSAETEDDLRAVQGLRYRVFVEEMGATGEGVDHERKLECDGFDAHARHLMLFDRADPAAEKVVGTYRMLTPEGAEAAGGYYSGGEYDLSPILRDGRRVLELGRSCLDPAHRGGFALPALFEALERVAREERIDLVIGVASFPGTDAARLAAPLSLLRARHLAPLPLRVRATGPDAMAMPEIAEEEIDRVAAMSAVPALIKAYLRRGALVGEGAYVDRQFNCTDICLILPIGEVAP